MGGSLITIEHLANRLYSLLQHQGVRRYAFNTGWLFFEYSLRAVTGVLVGIYVARYLGPERFGIFSYISSVVAIFAAVARLGLDGIMTREFVQRPQNYTTDLGTAFWMMIAAGIVNLIFLVGTITIFDQDYQHGLYALLAGGIIVFQSFGVIDWFFQSRVQAKYVTACRVVGLVMSSGVRMAAVLLHADLLAFFVITLFDQALLATLYLFIGKRRELPAFFSCFSIVRAKELFHSSWPLIFTALAITLYMKIDQIMIKSMLGEREVGIYSAAVKIYEAWIMIPFMITVSLIPAIVKAKSLGETVYQQRLVYLFRFIFWSSVIAAAIVITFSNWIILHSFGPAYQKASSVQAIVMFTAAWAALGSGSARYLVIEGMEKKIAVRTISAVVVNGLLNLALIPRMGIQGAAIATLVCTFTANYLMDWFDPDLRTLLVIKHRAIFFLK